MLFTFVVFRLSVAYNDSAAVPFNVRPSSSQGAPMGIVGRRSGSWRIAAAIVSPGRPPTRRRPRCGYKVIAALVGARTLVSPISANGLSGDQPLAGTAAREELLRAYRRFAARCFPPCLARNLEGSKNSKRPKPTAKIESQSPGAIAS